MEKEVTIQTVCGVGVGSSQFLKMQIEDVAKKNGITNLKVFIGDVLTSTAVPCDVIFTSEELAETIGTKARVPVVVINNFVSKDEITGKLIDFLKTIE